MRDLSFQQAQRRADVAARMRRRDHHVDVSALGRDVRVDQRVLVLLLQLQPQLVDVLAFLGGFGLLLAVDEADGTRRTAVLRFGRTSAWRGRATAGSVAIRDSRRSTERPDPPPISVTATATAPRAVTNPTATIAVFVRTRLSDIASEYRPDGSCGGHEVVCGRRPSRRRTPARSDRARLLHSSVDRAAVTAR